MTSSGPNYTYHSGGNFSMIDYIITNKPASDLLIAAKLHPDHPLNVSDHLLLTVSLDVNVESGKTPNTKPRIKLDTFFSTLTHLTYSNLG